MITVVKTYLYNLGANIFTHNNKNHKPKRTQEEYTVLFLFGIGIITNYLNYRTHPFIYRCTDYAQ